MAARKKQRAKAKAPKGAKKPTAKKAAAKKQTTKRPGKAPARKGAVKSDAPPAPPAPPVWAWHELMTSDLAGARAFYGGLFGWGADEMPMDSGPYTIFTQGGEGLGGMMAIPQGGGAPVCPPNWMVYLGVPDVDTAAAKAVALGGKVQVPPTDIPGVGRFSVLADPQGAVFAVYQSKRA